MSLLDLYEINTFNELKYFVLDDSIQLIIFEIDLINSANKINSKLYYDFIAIKDFYNNLNYKHDEITEIKIYKGIELELKIILSLIKPDFKKVTDNDIKF